MPHRFLRWLGQGVFGRLASRKAASRGSIRQAATRSIESLPRFSTPLVENLEARQLLSATYFVSTTGSDSNAGNINNPFRSIQHAANIAQSGDVVDIETGTYHETVTPKNSGVTFQPLNGEKVTVSGADAITGWSNYSGQIYSASMPTDLGLGNNEVFANGQELNEARYPNSSLNQSTPATATMQSISVHGNRATIYDSGLTQAAGYWKGAIIHLDPGQNWVNQTGTVTASSPGSVTFSFQNGGGYAYPKAGNKYYLIGKLQSLTAAGDEYRDPTSGKLYVWLPSGGNPSSSDVEAKVRQYAFDLSKVSNITIQGINIFSATIKTTGTSKNVVLNHINAQYVSKFDAVSSGWWVNPYYGIMLNGNGDVLENSTVAGSSGDGVEVSGSGVLVTNNFIHDVDTVGADLAGIRVLSRGNTISHNTVYNAGRDGIIANVPDTQILYNTVHDVGLQTTEPGGIYTVQTNGGGKSVIADNTVYNIHTAGYGGTAIFLDNSTSGWVVHNNVTYNVDYGIKLNFTCNNDSIYSNTFGANILSLNTNQQGNWDGTSFSNNAFPAGAVYTPGARLSGNTKSVGGTVGAGTISSGASGTVNTSTPSSSPPPVTTPPVTTPPTTTVPLATATTSALDYTAVDALKGDNFTGLGYSYNNDWAAYTLNFGSGVSTFTAGVAGLYANGKIEIHLSSPTGTLLGTLNFKPTGAWNNYTSESTAVSKITGTQTVYLVFKGSVAGIANIDWLKFS